MIEHIASELGFLLLQHIRYCLSLATAFKRVAAKLAASHKKLLRKVRQINGHCHLFAAYQHDVCWRGLVRPSPGTLEWQNGVLDPKKSGRQPPKPKLRVAIL